MPNQNINYNFTGTTGNLSAATSNAINLLGKYQNQIGQTASVSTKATSQLDKMSKSIEKMATPAKLANKALDTMKATMQALIGIPLGRVFEQAMVESIEYVENLNLFTVAMGESIEAGREFVNTVQEQYGLDPSNIMRYTGVFYQLASAIDVADETASRMSLGLTKMGVDISSLFNIPIDRVMENLSSGMQGMTRAVRKYGMDIRVSTLQTEAAALGIAGSVLTMSEANRQGLRYITMLKQMSNATGDFAKTIESPANQLRIMREQLMQLGRAIGDVFIGTFSKILPYINGVIMALRTVISLFAMFLGFKPMEFGGATDAAEGLGDSLGGVGEAAGGAAKEMKKLLAPFDELNILQKETASSGGGAAIGTDMMDPKLMALIAEYEAKFEGVRMKANELRDAILEFLGIDLIFDEEGGIADFTFSLDTLIQNLENLTGIDITKMLVSLDELWDTLSNFVEGTFGGGLEWLYTNVLQPLAEWTIEEVVPRFLDLLGASIELLGTIIEIFKPYFVWLWDEVLVPLATWTGGVIVTVLDEIVEGLKGFSDWAKEHKDAIQDTAETVVLFFAAWKVTELFAFISMSGGVVGALTKIKEALWLVTGAKIASKIETMKLTTMYAVDFIKSIWAVISNLGAQAGAFIAAKVQLMLLNVQYVLSAAKQWLAIAAMWAYVTALNVATAVTGFFSGALAFLAANPIVLIIGAIALLIAAIVLLVQNWDWVKETAIKAWDGIKKALEPIANWFKATVINPIIRQFNGFLGIIETVINAIVRGLNKISVKIPDWVPIFGGKTFSINMSTVSLPRVPELATGGVVTGPTMAMVGEGRYDEAVIPLGQSPQMAELINRIVEATSGGTNKQDIVINLTAELDGDVIYKNQKRVQASRGYDFGLGAFER